MIRTKLSILGAILLLSGTSCQMLANGPQLQAGMHRSAVGFGYSTYTIQQDGGPDVDVNSLSANISQGWFVSGNAEIGGQLVYESKEDDSAGSNAKTDSYLAAAFARWYFAGGATLYPYVEGLFGLGNSNVDPGNADDDFMRYSIGVGAVNFITLSSAIDAIVKWQADSYDTSNIDVNGIWVELAYSVFW